MTDDGIELPVIDITHPAFACDVSAEELGALVEETVRNMAAMAAVPLETRRAMAVNSILARGWVEASGTYMTGLMTYLNRLGPDNLGDGYAGPIDRRIAAGLAPLSFRFRLRDLARLIADALAAWLAHNPQGPVRLLNIGGGAAADSLNGLILLHKEHPELLPGRRITVHVLDVDAEGPAFGARALAALVAEGAPLAGLDAALEHTAYDWSDPAALAPGVAAVGSTEGALFDYGSDDEIMANLAALRERTPAGFVMTGSVVRAASTLDSRLAVSGSPPWMPSIRYIGLEAFETLARAAGWTIARRLESPMHHAISLTKA